MVEGFANLILRTVNPITFQPVFHEKLIDSMDEFSAKKLNKYQQKRVKFGARLALIYAPKIQRSLLPENLGLEHPGFQLTAGSTENSPLQGKGETSKQTTNIHQYPGFQPLVVGETSSHSFWVVSLFFRIHRKLQRCFHRSAKGFLCQIFLSTWAHGATPFPRKENLTYKYAEFQ